MVKKKNYKEGFFNFVFPHFQNPVGAGVKPVHSP